MLTLPDHWPVIISGSVSNREWKKKIIFALGIVEVVTGFGCILIGIVFAYYHRYVAIVKIYNSKCWHDDYQYFGKFNIGEALLCGVLISIAGRMGIVASNTSSNRWLVMSHMGFATLGATALAILYVSGIFKIFLLDPSHRNDFLLGVVLQTVLATCICFVILMVSASYPCCSNCAAGCCGSCCDDNKVNTHMRFALVGTLGWGIVFILCIVRLLILYPFFCSTFLLGPQTMPIITSFCCLNGYTVSGYIQYSRHCGNCRNVNKRRIYSTTTNIPLIPLERGTRGV